MQKMSILRSRITSNTSSTLLFSDRTFKQANETRCDGEVEIETETCGCMEAADDVTRC